MRLAGSIMAVSKKSKIGYFGTHLSDNMIETPEKCLVCIGAVIARTGFQEYKGKELLETEAEDLIKGGLKEDANYKVYRPEDEVFRPETIDSFQGKTFTLTHPGELLTIDTIKEHDCGHVMHVRHGTEPLPDGNWPLLADIMVTDRNVIIEIRNGLRELSCGYNYHIALQGENLIQVDIVGNHVALVKNGRAGKYAVIVDAAYTYEGFKRWLLNSSIETIATNLLKRTY
jgi:hypothetical protein